MAKRAARDRDYTTPTYFVAPERTPVWLTEGTASNVLSVEMGEGRVEVDADMLRSSERFPEEWPLSDYSKGEYLAHLGRTQRTAFEVYARATRRNDDLERAILEGVGVRFRGSPVWWVDLDTGPVHAASMFDLARLSQKPQPWKSGRGRKQKTMWLMSLEQWDQAEYPPESQGGPPYVQGVSVARERKKTRTRTRG